MAAVINISLRKLAEIAEKSPGYSVTALQDSGTPGEITEIAYLRTASGRRNRAYVAFLFDGKENLCPSESIMKVLD